MKKLFLVALTVFAVFALAQPAFAGGCPGMVKQIDKKIEASQVSGSKMKAVMELRNEGEALHKSGNHGASVKTLKKALALLGE